MKTITGKTLVLGIIGNPVSHSCSPQMHNAAFKHYNLDYIYVPFPVHSQGIKQALDGIKALHCVGINVTIPHKEAVIPFLDELDPFAEKVGAVNTILIKEGKLIGYNTDGPGFIYSIQKECNLVLNDKRITIIGAGGSAKAIAHSVINENISHLTLINRNVKKAQVLSENLSHHHSCEITVLSLEDLSSDPSSLQFLKDSDLVVNTTPIGMDPNITESPISDFSWVQKGQLCYDIIYKPLTTQFLINAKKYNATIMNGASMLAAQGLLAFTLFTGHNCNYDILKKELL